MRILIRVWSRDGGERTSVDRLVDAEILRIGRGTDQDLELPDLRLELAQAEIVRREANAYLIAKPGAVVVANGQNIKEHRLKGGDLYEIGRFKLQVGAAAAESGADFQLDVEETMSQRDERAQRIARMRTSLADLKISRRQLSWLLFVSVLIITLALPMWERFGQPSAAPAAKGTSPGSGGMVANVLWKPHELSAAHSFFKNDCGKCHEQPFKKVRNEACLSCHQDVHSHVADPKLAALPAFAGARCESCHREHQGVTARLVDRSDALCASCHSQIKVKFPTSTLESASSFSTQHPALSFQIAQLDEQSGKFEWVDTRGETVAAVTNLKFPHDFHLNPKGVTGPNGHKVLGCSDCHEPDAGGVTFKPVDMQQHCASCHSLAFDPDDPTRVLPHAQPAQIVGIIRDFYAREALGGSAAIVGAPDVVNARRAASQQLTAGQSRAALDWANQRSASVIDEVFTERTCNLCHTVQSSGDKAVPYKILPVAPQGRHRMAGATEFDHSQHAGEKCETCHAATTSKLSTDLLMPDIKRCRDCHGDPGSSARIQTACVDCHGFHFVGGASIAAAPSREELAAVAGPQR